MGKLIDTNHAKATESRLPNGGIVISIPIRMRMRGKRLSRTELRPQWRFIGHINRSIMPWGPGMCVYRLVLSGGAMNPS